MSGVRRSTATMLLLALISNAGLPRQAPSAWQEDEEVRIDAEEMTYDRDAGQVVARGKVVIRRGEMTLRADEVRIDRIVNQAEALGNVELVTPDGTVQADSARIDLADETGALDNAFVRSHARRYSLFGKKLAKGIGQAYHVEDGRFTTCDCGDRPPDWSISGDQLDVELYGYGRLRGGTFNVLDVPVLYLPVAWFPANLERQSGLLRPRFGASNRRGFQAVLPVYWAIDKSQDLTVAADVETNARLGVIAEYRYALARRTEGVLAASYFNELLGDSGGVDLSSPDRSFDPEDPEARTQRGSIPDNRWSVVAQHRQPLFAQSAAYVDGLIVSDDAFLRQINTFAFDYEADVKLRTLPYTESAVGAVRHWERAVLHTEAKFYQDLDAQGEPKKTTLHRAPRVSLDSQASLGDYVLGELESTFDNYQRGDGTAGLRLGIGPDVTLPVPLGHYAFGSVRTSLRETAYYLTETEQIDSDSGSLDRSQTRETIEVTGQLGTALTRVFDVQRWGLSQVQHTVEPALEYRYVPSVSQDDNPFFDAVDRINRRNLMLYGVATRFLGKFEPSAQAEGSAPEVRELARLWLAQAYDFSRRIARVDDTEEESTADHFSDLDFGARVNPARDFSVRVRSQYDAKNNQISAANVGLFLVDPRDRIGGEEIHKLDNRTSVGVAYRFLTANRLQELNSSLVLRLTDWLGFVYASRYDLVSDRFLDNHFGLRFVSTCDCWAFEIAVTDRTNPDEIEARAQLTLLGLGSLGGGRSDAGVAERVR